MAWVAGSRRQVLGFGARYQATDMWHIDVTAAS